MKMHTERSHLSVRYWILGFAVVIMGALVFVQLTPTTMASGAQICGGLSQELNPAKLGFQLPRSAGGMISDCETSDSSVAVKVRFNMAPADLEAFMQKVGVEHWQTKAETRAPISYLDDTFVARMASYLYTDESTALKSTMRVLVDLSNVQQFTVYIERTMPN